MSASWASSRGEGARQLAWLVALLGVIAVAPGVADAARSDSLRRVTGIHVSDEGIRIRGGGRDTTLAGDSLSEPVDATIDVGDRAVRIRGNVIETRQGGKDVRVVGPVVLVNGEGADMVRVFADAEVPAGQRVEGDVVAVFGSVTVKGEVSGNAVSVFGSLRLEPGAVVDGDAVAVGGVLDQQPGATVSGQSVSIEPGFDRHRIPGLVLGHSGVLLLLVLAAILPVLAGWLFLLIAPSRMLRVAVTATRRPFVSLLLGLVAGPLMIIALVLLLVTVVGIPIALLLPILFCLVAWAGQVATTYVMGCRLMRRRLGEGGSVWPYIAGTLFVGLLVALGFAGLVLPGPLKPIGLFFLMLSTLLALGLNLIGTGAALLSKLGTTPRDVVAGRDALVVGHGAVGAAGS